jgi:hypothetical protein
MTHEELVAAWKDDTGHKSAWEAFGEPGDGYYLEVLNPKYLRWIENRAAKFLESANLHPPTPQGQNAQSSTSPVA